MPGTCRYLPCLRSAGAAGIGVLLLQVTRCNCGREVVTIFALPTCFYASSVNADSSDDVLNFKFLPTFGWFVWIWIFKSFSEIFSAAPGCSSWHISWAAVSRSQVHLSCFSSPRGLEETAGAVWINTKFSRRLHWIWKLRSHQRCGGCNEAVGW